jgi:hypothetical protein
MLRAGLHSDETERVRRAGCCCHCARIGPLGKFEPPLLCVEGCIERGPKQSPAPVFQVGLSGVGGGSPWQGEPLIEEDSAYVRSTRADLRQGAPVGICPLPFDLGGP